MAGAEEPILSRLDRLDNIVSIILWTGDQFDFLICVNCLRFSRTRSVLFNNRVSKLQFCFSLDSPQAWFLGD